MEQTNHDGRRDEAAISRAEYDLVQQRVILLTSLALTIDPEHLRRFIRLHEMQDTLGPVTEALYPGLYRTGRDRVRAMAELAGAVQKLQAKGREFEEVVRATQGMVDRYQAAAAGRAR